MTQMTKSIRPSLPLQAPHKVLATVAGEILILQIETSMYVLIPCFFTLLLTTKLNRGNCQRPRMLVGYAIEGASIRSVRCRPIKEFQRSWRDLGATYVCSRRWDSTPSRDNREAGRPLLPAYCIVPGSNWSFEEFINYWSHANAPFALQCT